MSIFVHRNRILAISNHGRRSASHGSLILKSTRKVQTFIGLSSYYRKFIKGFWIIAKPLDDLIIKNTPFKFGDKEIRAFETLKAKLTSAPILSIYNPHDKTELHCDASALGFGAVLMQRKSNGIFYPIFYFSKRATEPESRHCSFELETLAVIYALRLFRVHLIGLELKITTDRNALKLTLAKQDVNP